MPTKAGIVTVAGRPNAGKSTLLNRLVGEHLAITSPKPQSTRDRVIGLITDNSTQIILHDTPGLLAPAYALQSAMQHTSLEALRDADVIVHLIDASEGHIETLAQAAGLGDKLPGNAPVILALNKSDALNSGRRDKIVLENPGAVLISAQDGSGIPELLERIRAILPEHPFYYPAEDLSTQQTRFFVAEMVRETALEQLDDEVPYSIACEIEEFRETRTPVYIRAVLHVERESQKRILIGADGSRIKTIGKDARRKIERLLGGQQVYLDLWVKVLANWRRDSAALRRLGYHVPGDSK